MEHDTLRLYIQCAIPRKNVEFYEDKGLGVRFRSGLADFKESGYDRGHMVGLHMYRADVSPIYHRLCRCFVMNLY